MKSMRPVHWFTVQAAPAAVSVVVVPAVAAPPELAWLNSIVPMARGRMESTGKRVVAAATVRRGVCSAIP